jgi:hypothetical protein
MGFTIANAANGALDNATHHFEPFSDEVNDAMLNIHRYNILSICATHTAA